DRMPLLRATVWLNPGPPPRLRLPGVETESIAVDTGLVNYDLSVVMFDPGSEITASITYARDLFERATIERLGSNFVRLLAAAVAAPVSPLPALAQGLDMQGPTPSAPAAQADAARCSNLTPNQL